MAKGGKLRKARSAHTIPNSSAPAGIPGPATSQPAPATVSTATATSSPIALKTSKASAATVTPSNHDDFSSRGSPVATSIYFDVGSPSSGSVLGDITQDKQARPKSLVSKQSSSSLRSSDRDHSHSSAHSNQHTDTQHSFSAQDSLIGIPASSSASALSLLRERLTEDEAARKRQVEEEAEKAAGPRKLHKKRGPSEANSPPTGIVEETGSLADEATVVGDDDEESRKVTQIGQGASPLASPEITAPTKGYGPSSGSTEVQPISSGWIPTLAIPNPQAVFSYATSTARATAATAYKIATLPITVPLGIARQVPVIRSLIPAAKKPADSAASCDKPAKGSEVDGAPPKTNGATRAGQAKDESVGVVWRTAELGLGLGLAAVLVGAAGADFAVQRVAGWRRKDDKPAGIIH